MATVRVMYQYVHRDGYCGDVDMTSTAEVQYEVKGSTVTWSTDIKDITQEDVRVALQRELQDTLVSASKNEFVVAPRKMQCEASEFRAWASPYMGARVVISPASVVLTLDYLDCIVEIDGLPCTYRCIEDVHIVDGKVYKLHAKGRRLVREAE